MDLSKLNAIARGGFLPTKKLADLHRNVKFMVTQLKYVTTKYGTKVVAELDSEFEVFLPKRVSSDLVQDEKFFFELADAANKYELLNLVENECCKYSSYLVLINKL